jgi:hypothetical protein
MPRSVNQLLKSKKKKNNEASQRFLVDVKRTVAKNAVEKAMCRLP